MEILFWCLIIIVVYTYLGYGLLLYLLVLIKRVFTKKTVKIDRDFQPEVTFIVAAYNEERWITEKIRNSVSQEYPKDKIRFVFITDGSDDGTPEIVQNYQAPEGIRIDLYHQPERKGKTIAIALVGFYLPRSVMLMMGMAVWSYLCLWLAKYLDAHAPWPLWAICLVIFAAAWIGQFYGHKVEGKKPSFLKDLAFLLIGPAWLMAKVMKQVGLAY